jgi:hypothetical protein
LDGNAKREIVVTEMSKAGLFCKKLKNRKVFNLIHPPPATDNFLNFK